MGWTRRNLGLMTAFGAFRDMPDRMLLLFSVLSHAQLFCDPKDCSPPGSSVRGIFQARILEWVAISFSRGSSHLRDWTASPALAGGFFVTEPPGSLPDRIPGSKWLKQQRKLLARETNKQDWLHTKPGFRYQKLPSEHSFFPSCPVSAVLTWGQGFTRLDGVGSSSLKSCPCLSCLSGDSAEDSENFWLWLSQVSLVTPISRLVLHRQKVILILTGIFGLCQEIEIDKKAEKKFRQGFVGASTAAVGSENK